MKPVELFLLLSVSLAAAGAYALQMGLLPEDLEWVPACPRSTACLRSGRIS